MKRNVVISIFPMLLLSLAGGVLMLRLLISGAYAYGESQQALSDRYFKSVTVDYVSAKALSPGDVWAGDFQGLPALFIDEEIDGTLYRTAVYCHDGYLKELFAAADSGLSPESGLELTPCGSFEACESMPGLRRIDFEYGGLSAFGYIGASQEG